MPSCLALVLAFAGTSAAEARAMSGGARNDHLVGTQRPDVIRGFAGDDSLDARGGGRDKVYGGPGNDTLAADGVDLVDAGSGRDRITVTAGRALPTAVRCGRGRDKLTFIAAAFISSRVLRARTAGCERIRVQRPVLAHSSLASAPRITSPASYSWNSTGTVTLAGTAMPNATV